MSLFNGGPKSNGFRSQQNGLPVFSSAVQEKIHRNGHSQSWTVPLLLPIPGVKSRRLYLPAPNLSRAHQLASARFGRRRGLFVLILTVVFFTVAIVNVTKRIKSSSNKWTPSMDISLRDPPTLVYEREDLQRIWEWEIASGHYPSNRERMYSTTSFITYIAQKTQFPVPQLMNFTERPLNPALPAKKPPIVLQPKPPSEISMRTLGYGPKRVYLDIKAEPPHVAYPPRPVPGSVADMDIVMEHCDFSTGKVLANHIIVDL
jgi:DDB1- and CUL4-associated factor 13